MTPADARFARGLCAAIVTFDLAFVAPSWAETRVLWYLPLEHAWQLAQKPAALAMDWYGRMLLAVGAALLVFLVARRWTPASPARTTALWTSWAVLATMLTLALHVFQLVTRHPMPEPIPAWYVPR